MANGRIVITGGAGFIGVHVVKELFQEGYRDLVVLDSARNTSAAHLALLKARTQVISLDILSPDLASVVLDLRADALIHLAAIHQANYCEANRAEAINVNVGGTERVIGAAVAAEITRIFIASSSAVYAPSEHPRREGDRLLPSDLYGLTKVVNEEQVRLWSARSPATRFAIGRFFNAVGALETSPRLVPEVVRRALRSDRIEVGNLAPRRDYVHAKDIARAIVCMLYENNDAIDICNIGTGTHWSVEEVIAQVAKLLGKRLRLESVEKYRRPNEQMLIAADIGRITSRYGWKPLYTLEAALNDAINFLRMQSDETDLPGETNSD